MTFEIKEKYGMSDLLAIMKLLRSENGCPWDREQNHKSIRRNLIEEAYEVAEAIDNEDTENLREELGDLLLQVVFHSEMEEETGAFTFDDVTDEICKKLIVRHPHIFSDVTADTTDEVLKNWESIKMETKGQKSASQSIDSVPRSLPALMRSEKIQKRAAKVGFDWNDVYGAMDKVREEMEELREAIEEESDEHSFEELGDLLFAVVNVSRFIGADAEHSLSSACDKFARRFALCERLAAERGIDMQAQSLEQLDELWNEAKATPNEAE
ncbi:MAG: nucleoside triphosphate pyrophosphohydrolase [Oscillospiraceae bacterium]|jgi:tetrapyrrole methylase family protein/MazG family protein|nr:nucleoside triphosphate pyrophosphohydrolase [Oscillospiraceae bacterium]